MVIQDMISFAYVLFAFILLFSVLILKLTFTEPRETWTADHSYLDALKLSFMMMMVDSGNLIGSFDTIWGFWLYILACTVMVIVMLNLLIAVVSDTYEKVTAMQP